MKGKERPLTRRQFFKKAALIGGVTLGGGWTILELGRRIFSPEDPFSTLAPFVDQTLPKEKVSEMAHELEKRGKRYSSFGEAGRFLVENQSYPGNLQKIESILTTKDNGPIPIKLARTVLRAQGTAYIEHEFQGKGIELALREKSTGIFVSFVGANPIRNDIFIALDNSVIKSPVGAKFLLTKEVQSLLSYPIFRQRALGVLRKAFDLEEARARDPQIETRLWATVLLQLRGLREYTLKNENRDLLEVINFSILDIDGAGYFFTLPDFGKLKYDGSFSPEDIRVLASNNQAFMEALAEGLLISNPLKPGEFYWREEVNPTTQEWLKIIRPKVRTS